MKILPLITFAALVVCAMQAQAESDVHQGQYQKNLKYKGPVTGDEIIYTLYLPPGHAKDKGPYPLIVFLHGAGGGNASSQVMQSYEDARKAGKIGNFAVVFPEKYGGTVWRDGAKDKRPETNVLKELLPHLEKEHALTRDRSQRTIMGFSMALDAGGGTSFTDPQARNYVPEYGKKTKAIQETLKLRLVQGGLNTKKFRDSLDQLKISYDYFQLPKDIAAYPAGSCCLNKKDPTRKFLHNPTCMTEGAWGVATWAFIEKNTLREKINK
jgi:hypothetical protein